MFRSHSIYTAVCMYYERIDLSNTDIKELSAKSRRQRLLELKKMADQMKTDGVPVWDVRRVETTSAYKAWGFEIHDIETRNVKLQKLRCLPKLVNPKAAES